MAIIFQQYFMLCVVMVGIFGLCIGSFLNVVIYRLPLMMEAQWRAECAEYLNQPAAKQDIFNLCVPRSHCPNCKTMIPLWHNIPLLSFILLLRKCRHCQQKISWVYPLVELISGLSAAYMAYRFGFSWQMIGASIFSWFLIASIFIDIKHLLLPDTMTLSLLWLGLLWNLSNGFTSLENAVIGAVMGYVVLWCIAWLFKKIRKMDGMGYGDFKLTAALGAWLGWQLLPFTIMLAAVLGAVLGILIMVIKKYSRTTPLPFGPYLAVAGWVALLWGHNFLNWYWKILT